MKAAILTVPLITLAIGAGHMDNRREIASRTARNGLQNEEQVSDLFSAWEPPDRRTPDLAQALVPVDDWLRKMGHDPLQITRVQSTTHNDTFKRDLTIQVWKGTRTPSVSVHQISVKLLSSRLGSGTNQVQRLTIESFVRQFSPPPDVAELLKLYTGATAPDASRSGLSDARRVRAHEFSADEQRKVVAWLETHQNEILRGIFEGPDPNYRPDYLLIVKQNQVPPTAVIAPIGHAINVFSRGGVRVEDTSFRIGSIIIQRKGGGRGATDLQFKCPFNLLQ